MKQYYIIFGNRRKRKKFVINIMLFFLFCTIDTIFYTKGERSDGERKKSERTVQKKEKVNKLDFCYFLKLCFWGKYKVLKVHSHLF